MSFFSASDQFDEITNEYQRWLKSEFCSKEKTSTTDHGAKNLQNQFIRFMEELRQQLIVSSVKYNDSALIFGMSIFFTALLVSLGSSYRSIINAWTNQDRWSRRRVQFLFIGCLLHTLSFASSSFIEEEHYTWLFLFSTYVTFRLIDAIGLQILRKRKSISTAWFNAVVVHGGLIFLSRILRSWNRAGIKWRHLECVTDWLIK